MGHRRWFASGTQRLRVGKNGGGGEGAQVQFSRFGSKGHGQWPRPMLLRILFCQLPWLLAADCSGAFDAPGAPAPGGIMRSCWP
ncbi:unnamed protein product [Symbiodinium sp. CCMP2592]|nr:unnamed protein product [Symbiodinium sp. CCMP2592]